MVLQRMHAFGDIYRYRDWYPQIAEGVFVAPGARIIGNVTIGARSGVWYNAVIRGDVNSIIIGEESNIQDGAVLHVDSGKDSLTIGRRVTVGHLAMLHACLLEEECLIGISATVLNGAVVERHALVAAGAVVPPNARLAGGRLYAGVPAKPIRDLSVEEIAHFRRSSEHYVEYARHHVESLSRI